MQSVESFLSKARSIYALAAVIIDEFPDGRAMGGSGFNFSYYTHKFGKKTFLISGVGKDAEGDFILQNLRDAGMSDHWVEVNAQVPSGYLKVVLDDKGIAQYLVRENTAYDFVRRVPPVEVGSIAYFGSPEQRHPVARQTIRNWVAANQPDALLLCDLNLRTPFYTADIISHCFANTHVLKLSIEEVFESAKVLSWPEKSELEIISRIFKSSTILRWVIITRGAGGATLYTAPNAFEHFSAPKVNVVDTVGAGDAFCARFISLLMEGKNARESMVGAVKFASHVCRFHGAILTPAQIAEFS